MTDSITQRFTKSAAGASRDADVTGLKRRLIAG